jgi:flagellar motor protein MotB
MQNKNKELIKSIVISGHTDKTYQKNKTQDEGYMDNMVTSQKRAFNVLDIFLKNSHIVSEKHHLWFRQNTFALGQSWNRFLGNSSISRRIDIILNTDNTELHKVLKSL